MAKEKIPPRQVVGKTICMHRNCNEVATIKTDAGGYLFLSCPVCGTMNNRRASYQAALLQGMDEYAASQDEKQPEKTGDDYSDDNQEGEKKSGLFGGLAIFR